MSTIVVNQKRAFLASAMDDARNLVESLKYLSEAQRAAILAVVAKKSDIPVDMNLQCDLGDEIECYSILDGVLERGPGPYAWKTAGGCLFQCLTEEHPHE